MRIDLDYLTELLGTDVHQLDVGNEGSKEVFFVSGDDIPGTWDYPDEALDRLEMAGWVPMRGPLRDRSFTIWNHGETMLIIVYSDSMLTRLRIAGSVSCDVSNDTGKDVEDVIRTIFRIE